MALFQLLSWMALLLPVAFAQPSDPRPRVQIVSRDPCDPRRIDFDPSRCIDRDSSGAGTRGRVGIRIEYGTAAPVRGSHIQSVTDPVLLASESAVFNWGISRLALSQDDYDGCLLSISFYDCAQDIQTQRRRDYADHYSHVGVTPIAELERELRSFDPTGTSGIPSERLRAELLVYRILMLADADRVRTLLLQEGGTLPVRERLLVAQRIGGYLLSAYDNDRNAAGVGAQGGISLQELLTLQRDLHIARPGGAAVFFGFPPYAGLTTLGVCRDIVSAQGELLQLMGFDQTYIIAYFSSGELHTTILTEDPENRGKYYRLNYYKLRTAPGSGPDMLNQDDLIGGTDVTLRYWVHRPGGPTIASFPSELHLLITRAMRGDAAMEDLAPGYVPKGWVAAGNVDFSALLHARVFYGQNSRGEQYGGAGLILSTGDSSSIFSLETGVAPFMRQAGDTTIHQLFAYAQGNLRSPELVLGRAERIRVHLEGMLYVAGMAGTAYRPGSPDDRFANVDARATAGIGAIFGNRRDRINVSLRGQFQAVPGVGEITDVSTFGASLDQALLEGQIFFFLSQSPEGRDQLAKSAAGRAYLYGAVTAMFDEWGQLGIARIGLQSAHFGVEGRVSGRMQTSSPIFRPSSIREVGLKLIARINASILGYVEITQPLEAALFEGVGRQLRVGGQANVPWGRSSPR